MSPTRATLVRNAVRSTYQARAAAAHALRDYGAFVEALADLVFGVDGSRELDVQDLHDDVAQLREQYQEIATRLDSMDRVLADLRKHAGGNDDA